MSTKNKNLKETDVGEISVSKKILIELLDCAGYIYETGMNSYRPFRLPKEYRKLNTRSREYQRIKQLEYRKFVSTIKHGDQIFYKITEKGHISALKTIIINQESLLPEGEFCLVVFDVPEHIRKVRFAFRSLLKNAGFYKVQRSVWESEKDVVEELRTLVKLLDVEEYITVYRANGPR